ncbi:MAG TPA: magnesium-protoporphyrin IX monomethyl ester (oxidative) cyclase [Cyanobacteria bacterium UBA11149]|nr:magnesium-protoporphyrin IX monomethyl ester (oxidative) cyclase [Cyanobacteria bacterium UBA11367]HBE60063.1 magnesium-protoporphyrin IX monomethyl ester (oxidative) cyclase [Cyanobacteria bacterium UBA11366]HBS72508.1 magnesium-protoporphyrin IX monomethyl ester (oxidative) cyclase [Cyanobacteria bacterium UBA11153]HBW87901.1 magnesium-protoporphyrin IX monomethyl ester (oxidative) cyclase [Cyanobacteria bacterium UBA11149]HCA97253.1 magnesium-protoporphyrin IX monomethyl ester (oxidative)
MVSSPPKPTNLSPAKTKAIEENILTPRFYTTDFETAASLDLSTQNTEFEAMLEEMRADYNRHHFVRDEEFNQSWDHITGEGRQAFIDYLERSCVSEFSGFLLFKELSRKLKDRNPKLAEMFSLMARDEARHAGFLNKAMGDFGCTMDLAFLTKNRVYTFFPIEWVLYTVYLSEKIGYWRYIIIYRHLEKHPENQFYPLFRMFESWCQDENRHGDIFKALLRSQPKLWQTWQSKLWSRFFLLTVFATHTLTVHERTGFYKVLGLDPTEFDAEVIRKTNETSLRAFPSVLNTEHPEFFPRLRRCSDLNLEMSKIERQNQPKWLKTLRKLPLQLKIVGHLLRIYLTKGIDAEAIRGTVL